LIEILRVNTEKLIATFFSVLGFPQQQLTHPSYQSRLAWHYRRDVYFQSNDVWLFDTKQNKIDLAKTYEGHLLN
jgi:hypothetical protein